MTHPRTAAATRAAVALAPLIEELRASGCHTAAAIAAALNARGVPSPAGKSVWHRSTVDRLLRRLGVDRSRSAKRTREHCARGHAWTAETMHVRGGYLICRICDREDRAKVRARRLRQAAAVQLDPQEPDD
jgi:hypothetical protein